MVRLGKVRMKNNIVFLWGNYKELYLSHDGLNYKNLEFKSHISDIMAKFRGSYKQNIHLKKRQAHLDGCSRESYYESLDKHSINFLLASSCCFCREFSSVFSSVLVIFSLSWESTFKIVISFSFIFIPLIVFSFLLI